MVTNERLIFLFQRYVDGYCTEAERLEFLHCVSNTSHHQHIQALMDELWTKLPEEKKLSAHQAQRILDTIIGNAEEIQPAKKQIYLQRWVKVAASLLLIAVCTGIVYLKTGFQSPAPFALDQKKSVTPTYKSITLPDGSTVRLNYSSQLDYPETFDGLATREVYLKGEGFFDITHHASKPFIVHTGQLKTIVLGTAFNIKAYAGEKSITVTVARGKVQVSNGKKTLDIITRDQQLTFHKTNKESERKQIDATKATAWQAGNIYFDDITLEGAVQQLEERFHVKIAWSKEKLKDCRFTASFAMGESLEEIIHVLCEFNKTRYKKDERGNFIIEGEGC